MSEALVSIVIPIYNAESTLASTVASIEAQTHANFEVILIDDGSSDGSAALADSLVEADSRIRVIHIPNGGVSRARNIGLDEARGEYVVFADADDLLDLEAVEILLDDAISNSAAIAICGMSFDTFGENGCPESTHALTTDWSGLIGGFAHADCAYSRLYEANYVQSACAKIFRMEELRACGIRFDEKLSSYEDHVFVLDCLARLVPVFVDERVLYHYCLRPGCSNSTRFKVDMTDQMARVAERELEFYSKTLLSSVLEDAYRHAVQFLVVAVNNAAKEADATRRKNEITRIFSLPVFNEAAKCATSFPNLYSRIVAKLGVRGCFKAVLFLAFIRNLVRGV